LAGRYEKSRKANGWFGVLSYFGGTFFGGICLGLIDVMFGLNIDWDNDILMNLLGIPFGVLGCVGLYMFLEKKWDKEIVVIDSIEEIGTISND
jgi:FtsH-binding integral membrane protein